MMCRIAKWFLCFHWLAGRLPLIYAVLMLSGCTTLSIQNMLPEVHKETLISNQILRIGQVSGGEVKTHVMSRSVAPSGTITPEVFAETLYQALERSGIFAGTVRSGAADLQLDAHLVSQEMSVGYPMTATLFVRYHLTDVHSEKTRWEKSIVSIGKSPASEVFRDRQKLANERAVQENLRQLLVELSAEMAATKEQ